jgi:hypothetical protein
MQVFNRFREITVTLRLMISCNSGDQNSVAVLLHPSAQCGLGFHYVGFEALTAGVMNVSISWDIPPRYPSAN